MGIGISWTSVLSLIIGLALVSAGAWWLAQYEEYQLLDIMAPRGFENTLPVYAQFTVTQTFMIDHLASLTRLAVPLFLPETNQTLHITLRQRGQMIEQWQYTAATTGEVTAHLTLIQPSLLEGMAELQFTAEDIAPGDQDKAPRLFTEVAGGIYSGGNYRIAENEKKADVALQAYERRRNGEQLQRLWQAEPLTITVRVVVWILVATLLMSLPHVLRRTAGY